MTQANFKHCPCGSQQAFSACCEPYLNDLKQPETPEALMRSRYVAYTHANIPYIQKTMRGKAAKNYDPISAYQWASSVKWVGLTVLKVSKIKKNRGAITFIAVFLDQGQRKEIREKSFFTKIEGQWFYTEGEAPIDNRSLS